MDLAAEEFPMARQVPAAEEFPMARQVPAEEEFRMVRDILPVPEETVQARLRQVPAGPELIPPAPEGVMVRQTRLILIRRKG